MEHHEDVPSLPLNIFIFLWLKKTLRAWFLSRSLLLVDEFDGCVFFLH